MAHTVTLTLTTVELKALSIAWSNAEDQHATCPLLGGRLTRARERSPQPDTLKQLARRFNNLTITRPDC